MSDTNLPKRFYNQVGIAPAEPGFAVTLDGRTPKTPAKNSLILPNESSAQLVAEEWESQGEVIDPFTMPITRLVNVAIDRAPLTRQAMIDEVAKYAATDLVCYRAATPESLVNAQAAAWDPILDWARAEFGIKLSTTTNALAIEQPESSLRIVADLASELDHLPLTALAFANGLCGSALVALALIKGFMDGEQAFEAIRIEEDWQAARWGRDPDEEKIANARRVDLVAIGRLVRAL
jgi:chaperone required for assembly of F1-ATPase